MSHYRVIVLGGGMSGLAMGVALKRRGIERFVIVEKADRVGGTWRENTYPGVACDVPSHLYSFSFDLNPRWSRLFSPGHEIQAYCERSARSFGLISHIHFGTTVEDVRFDGRRWVVTTDGDEMTADVVVSALGGLHVPNVPTWPGLERFSGDLFHTARWDHACSLEGRRVGIVGSGATAVQVIPEIVDQCRELTLFQRTPGWVVPRGDRAIDSKLAERLATVPYLNELLRLGLYLTLEARGLFVKKGSWVNKMVRRQAEAYLAREIDDPVLRDKVTPDFDIGCKRLMLSDDYYAALASDHVDVVTEGIRAITERGVMTPSGREIELDVLIAATGFRPFDITTEVGFKGRENVALQDEWRSAIYAHRTMMVPNFPNLFFLLGPNSGLGHNSVLLMIEAQARFVLKALLMLERRGARTIEPTSQSTAAYDAKLQRDLGKTVFGGGCRAWYTDDNDRNFTLWPHSTPRYFASLRNVVEREYVFT